MGKRKCLTALWITETVLSSLVLFIFQCYFFPFIKDKKRLFISSAIRLAENFSVKLLCALFASSLRKLLFSARMRIASDNSTILKVISPSSLNTGSTKRQWSSEAIHRVRLSLIQLKGSCLPSFQAPYMDNGHKPKARCRYQQYCKTMLRGL